MPAYKDKKRGTWYYQINYTDINGKHRTTKQRGFKTKGQAQDAEYKKRLELERDPKENIDLTFQDLYNYYLSYIKSRIKYSSYYSKTNLAKHHILPYFESKRVNAITTKDIIKWQNLMLENNYSHAYLSKIYTNLSTIIKHGVKFYGVKSNPCPLVGDFQNPNKIEQGLNYWTPDEFKQFISYVDDITYFTFFFFLYYTGARKGEALALTWKDINFKKHEVQINKTVSQRSLEGGWKIIPPKTKSSNRRILMPAILEEKLKLYYDWCKHYDSFNNNYFIFGISRPLPMTTVSRRFGEYIEASGVKKIKIHDIRHSHASLLINQGASILIVSQRLGHKDVKETLNTYSHMFPNKQKEVVDLIDNL